MVNEIWTTMDSDFLRTLYDRGNFPAAPGARVIFSKPFWRDLIHKTRTPQDRTAILTAKRFRVDTNPVIIPGVYTQPDAWMDKAEIAADPDRTIRIEVYRNARFAHNGANRPIDGLFGHGSVWWNRMVCGALNDIGVRITPSSTPEDEDWQREHFDLIDSVFLPKGENGVRIHGSPSRLSFIAALTARIGAAGIDILGNGGEFIIINQDVINWVFTRESSGNFQTKGQKQAAKRKEKAEDAIKAVEEAMRPFIADRFELPIMVLYKTLSSRRALVITHFFTRSENVAGDFLGAICAAADAHGVILAMPNDTQIATTDRHSKEATHAFLARNGFTHAKDKYLFREPKP